MFEIGYLSLRRVDLLHVPEIIQVEPDASVDISSQFPAEILVEPEVIVIYGIGVPGQRIAPQPIGIGRVFQVPPVRLEIIFVIGRPDIGLDRYDELMVLRIRNAGPNIGLIRLVFRARIEQHMGSADPGEPGKQGVTEGRDRRKPGMDGPVGSIVPLEGSFPAARLTRSIRSSCWFTGRSREAWRQGREKVWEGRESACRPQAGIDTRISSGVHKLWETRLKGNFRFSWTSRTFVSWRIRGTAGR